MLGRKLCEVQLTLTYARRGRVLLLLLSVVLATAVLARLMFVTTPASAMPRLTLAAAVALGVLVVGLVARARRDEWAAPALPRVALWIEEQADGTATYALVTWVELSGAPSSSLSSSVSPTDVLLQAANDVLARGASGGRLTKALSRRRWALWRGPMLFAAGAVLVLLIGERWSTATDLATVNGTINAGTPVPRATATRAGGLGRLRIRVEPPRYAGIQDSVFDDASSVRALSGSRIIVEGGGAAPLATLSVVGADSAARVAQGVLPVVNDTRDGWRLRFAAQDVPVALSLRQGEASRLLVVEGVRDSLPRVSLEAPARDSVFREPRGMLALEARASDDLGVASASFELVVSSGEGERFTVRTVLIGAQRYAPPARRVNWRGMLDLAALGLGPGDVVHVRAVARDAHPLAGREAGSSETRAFRIARPAEYDSVAVEPAPPPAVDSSLLSQRMLLMLTERLDARQKRMARAEVLRESLRIARDQQKLRLAVGDVVFQRLSGESSAEHAHYAGDGHDHGVDQQGGKLAMSTNSTTGMLEEGNDSPIVAINKPLLEAYNAMWDAGRALEQGDPRGAMPAMRRALEAIERSRAATRLYLRGRPPQVIVDLAKVRLTGKDTGQTLPRSTRLAVPTLSAQRDARLVAVAVEMARESATPNAERRPVRDSLLLLRAEALADDPAFAAALGRLLDAMSQGGDVTEAIVAARRVLGNVRRSDVLPWSSGTP
jgi:hypothetical protein